METILAESLLGISQKTNEDWGIKTFHIPYLPRCIYIEAPGIFEIQEFMKFSAYSELASRFTRISDDNRSFLYGTIPDAPCPGSWVRITQTGLYKGDLALVLSAPSEGDLVLIAIVPRFDVSQSKKRKGTGLLARPPPTLLDPMFMVNYPLDDNYIYSIRSRLFHRLGLEILRAPSAHALNIEPRPSEPELLLFQSSLERLDITHETGEVAALIRRAVNKAFRIESRRLWRTGDQVRILEGAFINTMCSILEIDEGNGFVIAEFGSPNPTIVEVSMEDVERHFHVGDQVRVALGKNKGSTGSIIEISNGVGTIVERTANQITEVNPPSHSSSFINYITQLHVSLLYLESHTLAPSFATNPHPAASSTTKPKASHESEATKFHQMLGGRDPRIGREAAVYVGQMKGYQGRLVDINQNTGKIECPGRQFPIYMAPLCHLVLM
jgi:ribosomal protein L24